MTDVRFWGRVDIVSTVNKCYFKEECISKQQIQTIGQKTTSKCLWILIAIALLHELITELVPLKMVQ